MKKRVFSLAAFALLALLLLNGCYPDKIDYIDEYDLAATVYDEDANFSGYSTFVLVDTIIHMTEEGEDDENLSRDHDAFILAELRQNMLDLGYTELTEQEIADSIVPDVVILPQALSSSYYQYYYYWYDYWGYYPGWAGWYPGWGGWYPGWGWGGYYPGYAYSYSTGTLIIDMMDAKVTDPETDWPIIVWTGLVDGILVNNSDYTRDRLEKQVNQLFEQSPYL